MQALISTTLHLLHLDLDTRVVTVLQNDAPEYYGITWQPGSSDLILSHSGIDTASLVTLDAYAHSEQGYLSFPGGRTAAFLSAPHQIQWCSDGRVATTNTGRNRLVVVDTARPGHYQEAGLSESRWDRLTLEGPFGDHLNSVFETDGKLYALAHGYASGSKLAVFSYPDMRLLSADLIPGRTGLHNIYAGDGLQLSCHSEAGALIDLVDGEILWEAGTPVYTRGLAVTEDYVLVGESAKTGRDLRRSSLSGLWILDRRTWKTRDYIPLGPYGAVLEVRAIDVPDFAHHGVPLAKLETLLVESGYSRTRRDRLARSEAAIAGRHAWRDFDPLADTTEAGEDGWRHGREGLSIMVRRPQGPSQWSFEYALETGGHVSVIADYDGRGGDSNMTALLLQIGGDGADLVEWRENGTGWQVVRQIDCGRLPASGRLSVRIEAGELHLESAGRTVHSQRISSTSLDRTGLRWSGASVRPVDA